MVISKKMAILPLALIVSFSNVYSMATWDQQPDSVLATQLNSEGVSLLSMKMAYAHAAPDIKGLVEHLKNPNRYNDPEYRFALMYGPPGTGKTTTACAIAQYANWSLKMYSPDSFQKGNRGEAAQNFIKEMNEIIASNANTLVVIDEANGLWEHVESKNHDNAETAKALWRTLDKMNGNNKIFLMAIANRIHLMPPQMKSRMVDHMFLLNMPVSNDDRFKTVNALFNANNINLTDAEGIKEIKNVIENNPKWTNRDYKGLVFSVKSEMLDFLNLDPTESPITAKIILTVAEKKAKRQKDIQSYDKELSETDRQDLYQAQNLWNQVLIQRFQKFPMFGFKTPGITRTTGNFILDKTLNDNQKRVAEENMNIKDLKAEHLMDIAY